MTIDDKKKALEIEIDDLKKELDDSINTVSNKVGNSFEPKRIIRKHPFKVFGATLLTGFLIAYKSSSKKSTSPIMSSIKKELSSRAISFLLDNLTNKSIKEE